eukprot:6173896-Pleurochrysis_carterae.AAC.1
MHSLLRLRAISWIQSAVRELEPADLLALPLPRCLHRGLHLRTRSLRLLPARTQAAANEFSQTCTERRMHRLQRPKLRWQKMNAEYSTLLKGAAQCTCSPVEFSARRRGWNESKDCPRWVIIPLSDRAGEECPVPAGGSKKHSRNRSVERQEGAQITKDYKGMISDNEEKQSANVRKQQANLR